MKVNIKPLGDYVVARAEEAAKKTASGIFIPNTATEKPQIAEILGVGSDVKRVKVGDRVVYKGGYGGASEVKVDANDYLLIKEEDILATVN
jgi:chaperonin GroES